MVRAMRVLALALLVACSKPSKEPSAKTADTAQVPKRATMYPVRQGVPVAGDTIEAEWHREIAQPRDRDLHGVDATKWRTGQWPWHVSVYVMQFIRDVPLEVELRRRIIAALRAVPGVTDVAEEDREVWMIRGEPSGAALVDAVAPIVDELAPKAREEIERSLAASKNDPNEQLLRAIETLPADDALYLDDVGWFQIRRYEAYEGKNPRTNERVHVPAKTLVMFEADGNLLNILNGRPREDLGDPTQSNRNNKIQRHAWAKPLASWINNELLTRRTATVADFGTLRVEKRAIEHDDEDPPPTRSADKRPIENRVFWEMSEPLRLRLNPGP